MDLIRSAEGFRKAAVSDERWNKDLFDVLWKMNTSESDRELFDIAKKMADKGNPEMIGRLGKAYGAGRGTEKDPMRAADCFRKAAASNKRWNKDLFDLLWKNDTPESDRELFEIAKKMADLSDMEMIGRLGKAYGAGRGTEKDPIRAADCFRKAAVSDDRWNKDLFDVLWKINTSESDRELFDIAVRMADKGNPEMIGRLGKAYGAGRGTEKDLIRSAECFRKVAVSNKRWNKDLFDVLWMINTPESIMELTDYAIETSNCSMDTWDGVGLPKSLGDFSVWFEDRYRTLQPVGNMPNAVEGRPFSEYLVHSLEDGIDDYNFIVCSDKNLADYLFVLIYSISRNCSLPSTIYVLQSDYPDYIVEMLKNYSSSLGVNIEFVYVEDSIFDKICEYSGRSNQWPNAAYYYLLAHEYLPSSVTRALYLDIDTLVLKDVGKFYSVDFEGSLMCASTEKRFSEKTAIQNEKMVFNSGVLMLNLEGLRNAGITIDDYVECASKFEDGFFADQQIVNTMFFRHCKLLPRCYYNALINYTENVRSLGKTNIRSSVLCNTIDELNSIVHYIGRKTIKAWFVPCIVSEKLTLGKYLEKTQYMYHRIWWDYALNIPEDILNRILLKPKKIDSCDNPDGLLTELLSSKTQLNWLHIHYYYVSDAHREEILDSIRDSSEKEYFVKRYIDGDSSACCNSICKDLIDDAVKNHINQHGA